MSDFPLHARVALVDGADDVYAFALAGTEGWVREVKVDEYGFDMIRVEWDKDHWRYNGQPDGWTFESHFKQVGDPQPPEIEEFEEEDIEPGDITFTEPAASEAQIEQYIEMLSEAMDAASDSEAFFMIAVRRIPNPDNPQELMFVPQIFMDSTSREGGLLLEIQLAECAANSYEEMVQQLIDQLRKHGSG